MSNFKEASKQKLRIQTNKGLLSPEQLWDLSLSELDTIAVSLEQEYKESGKKSFLVAKSAKDRIAKLKFEIVIEVLNTKLEESETLREAKEVKEHNSKIYSLIAEKEEDQLKTKSVKELEKLLKK